MLEHLKERLPDSIGECTELNEWYECGKRCGCISKRVFYLSFCCCQFHSLPIFSRLFLSFCVCVLCFVLFCTALLFVCVSSSIFVFCEVFLFLDIKIILATRPEPYYIYKHTYIHTATQHLTIVGKTDRQIPFE